jgi:hypothetical protein
LSPSISVVPTVALSLPLPTLPRFFSHPLARLPFVFADGPRLFSLELSNVLPVLSVGFPNILPILAFGLAQLLVHLALIFGLLTSILPVVCGMAVVRWGGGIAVWRTEDDSPGKRSDIYPDVNLNLLCRSWRSTEDDSESDDGK